MSFLIPSFYKTCFCWKISTKTCFFLHEMDKLTSSRMSIEWWNKERQPLEIYLILYPSLENLTTHMTIFIIVHKLMTNFEIKWVNEEPLTISQVLLNVPDQSLNFQFKDLNKWYTKQDLKKISWLRFANTIFKFYNYFTWHKIVKLFH